MYYIKSLQKSVIGTWFFLLFLFLIPSVCLSQVLNGSFEIDEQPSLENWIIGCNDGESFQDAPGGGGMWCLRFPTGNLQSCFPRTAEQILAELRYGDIVQVSVWARQAEQKPSQTSVYLKVFHADRTTILSVDTTTSNEWTQLTVVDTMFLEEGDSVAIVLDSGMTSGPDILGHYSYFDLVEEKRTEQIPVPVDDAGDVRIKDFKLFQNFPNPFNPITTIEYALPKNAHVELIIIDLLGRKVRSLIAENKHAGNHQVTWNGLDDSGTKISSGVYLYRMTAEGYTETRKLLQMR